MKVLMFGWEFPPEISGGLGRVCHALTTQLANLGTEILFVMPKAGKNRACFPNFELLGANEVPLSMTTQKMIDKLSSETVDFLCIDSILNPYMNDLQYQSRLTQALMSQTNVETIRLSRLMGHLDFDGGYGDNLFQEVSRYALTGVLLGLKGGFDVIHAHDWITFLAGVEAKRISGKPLICHVHATEFDRTGDHPNDEIYRIEKYGLEMADRVITVSHRTKDMVVQKYGIPSEKVFVVHNAVSKEKLLERDEIKKHLKEKIVLFLGRVTLQKGPDYFVEAARLVLKQFKNVRFVMAGTGDMLARLIERVASYRLQKHFHFTGFLRGREIEEMFALSDLYVMPSVSEPFGITPFEAMLYHVPIIISKQSGIAEILTHAIQVDFWDVEKLADEIIKILANEDETKKLIEEGAKELDKISWYHSAQKVLQHYGELTRL